MTEREREIEVRAKLIAVHMERWLKGLIPLYGRTVLPETPTIWAEDLLDLPIPALHRALVCVGRECEEFPTSAKVRKFACADEETAARLEAEQALAVLDTHVDRWGVDRLPEWGDGRLEGPPALPAPIAAALDAVGGWRAYASRPPERSEWMRRDFIAAYMRYSKARKTRRMLAEAAGFSPEVLEGDDELGFDVRKIAAARPI